MKLKIDVDVREMNRALQRFADVVGKDIAVILPDEARLFALSGMKAQPPTGSGGKGANTPEAKMNGEAAVDRSVRNAAPRLQPGQFKSPFLRYAIEKGNVNQTQALLDSMGIPIKVGAHDEGYHQKARDGRGRVHRMRRGNMLISDAEEAKRDAYSKRKQQNVGMFKAAWAKVALGLERYAKVKSRIPSWIKRHVGRSKFHSALTVQLFGARQSITISAPAHPAFRDFVGIAVAARVKAINRKARAVLAGRAGIIDGKYRIFKKDQAS